MSDTIWHCNFGDFTQQFRRNYKAILPDLLSNPGRFTLTFPTNYYSIKGQITFNYLIILLACHSCSGKWHSRVSGN